MATLLSETAGLLDEYLGSPPREVCDEQQETQYCLEAWSFYQHQAGPAMGRLLTGRFFELDPPAKEFQVNQDSFTAALYVEHRIDSFNDIWERVDIVSVPELDNATDIAEYACAFYGEPPTMRLSWNPATNPHSHLKIWHDPDADEPGTLDDDLQLPLRLLKYMIPRRGVILALPRLILRAPSLFTQAVAESIAKINERILLGYEQEWELWRFQGEEEGWSQMEGTMDRFYGKTRRSPRVFP